MRKSTIAKLHLIYWVITACMIFLRPLVYKFIPPTTYVTYFKYISLGYPIYFYIGYFFAFPMLRKRKLVFHLALGLVLTSVVCFLFSKEIFAVSVLILTSGSTIIVGAFFRFFIDWFSQRSERDKLKRENLKSELALLRNQINPHFLFNTLNNIDTLIKPSPEKASNSLIRVSDMMRYMLYDSSAERVDLSHELTYINNYIALEKLRAVSPEYITFEINGNTEGIQIAPMLLIPFIENAFKHSPVTDPDNRISVSIEILKHHISFSCSNKIDANQQEKDTTAGIGLSTVQRRLKLLYPGKHELFTGQKNDLFTVNLTLVVA